MKTVILTVIITLLVLGLAAETTYIYNMKVAPRGPENIVAARTNMPHAVIKPLRQSSSFDEDYQNAEWDPFAEMDRIQSQMNRLFRSSLSRGMLNQPAGFMDKNAFYEPDLDLQETPVAYIAKIDLPDMDKDKISIEVKNNMLTVSGQRNIEREEKGPNQFYSKERSFGSFSRAITLPADAKSDGMTAEYNKGVLVVTIPRQQQAGKDENTIKKIQVK